MGIFSPPLSYPPPHFSAPSLPTVPSPFLLYSHFHSLSSSLPEAREAVTVWGCKNPEYNEDSIADANYRKRTQQNMKHIIYRGVNDRKLFGNGLPAPEL